jgi:PAS domain S-box-containing protein
MASGTQSFDDELMELFDLAHDAFCITGFDGYLKRVNPAYARILGYTQEELLARPWMDNFHPDDLEAVKAALAEVVAGNNVVGFECREVCADGSVRWFEWSTSSRPEAGIAYAVGRDVTERHRANDELSALRRVATLAVEGVAPADLFAVVAEEVARVVDVPFVGVARYDVDDTATDCASFPPASGISTVGKRWSLDGANVISLVRDSSAPARVDDYSQIDSEIGETVRRVGLRSTVGVPIVVAGRMWGAMIASTGDPDPLPDDTAERLAHFTELLATAIADAESREALGRLAEQQAALRRVATLVARGAAPAEVFSTVADEMAQCLNAGNASVSRFDGDEMVILAVSHLDPGMKNKPAVGQRITLEGTNVAATVMRTGRPARQDTSRQDSSEKDSGAVSAFLRAMGFRCTVAVPIVVDGCIWGGAAVASSASEPLPPDTEARMGDFADLVATSIANAATRADLQASRDELSVLGEQQAALRRVATLVARGADPSAVFAAVVVEIAHRLHTGHSAIYRYADDALVPLAVSHEDGLQPLTKGLRLRLEGNAVAARVLATGGAARIDRNDDAPAPHAGRVRGLGLHSAVGVPIIVDGQVWGVAVVGSLRPEPLPEDTEARMSDFADLIGTSIAVTRSELIASRARIVAAADEGRRRLERDLHDGAQQRLVALGLQTRLAEASVPPRMQALKEQLGDIVSVLTGVSADLQEISRGIHPAILSEGGLGPALKTLARRSAVPVTLDLAIDRRLPDTVEVGAYYVVSEALTNAAKHSRASEVGVSGQTKDHTLSLSIHDDGIGGADVGKGSGLLGLKDRVEALGGRMRIMSPAGSGTSLDVTIPLDTP